MSTSRIVPIILSLFINGIFLFFCKRYQILILRIDLTVRYYDVGLFNFAKAISLVLLTATTNAAKM